MKFRISAKYFNTGKNKIELFTTYTDKPLKTTEVFDFAKKFLKDQNIVSVEFEPVDESGNIIGKTGKILKRGKRLIK